jgi:predicted RNA binding protein YcfA (HicA-like mRNA interferase family)
MSNKLPRITARDIVRVLEKQDFFLSRQSGSHKIYRNVQGRRVTVPYHSGKILHPKILQSILKDADINIEDLKTLLKK